MSIEHSIKMDEKGVQVTFTDNSETWYGEFTKKDYDNNSGWKQRGTIDTEKLLKTSDITEKYAMDFIDKFCTC